MSTNSSFDLDEYLKEIDLEYLAGDYPPEPSQYVDPPVPESITQWGSSMASIPTCTHCNDKQGVNYVYVNVPASPFSHNWSTTLCSPCSDKLWAALYPTLANLPKDM